MQRDAFMSLATFSNTGSTATGQTNNFDIERAECIMGTAVVALRQRRRRRRDQSRCPSRRVLSASRRARSKLQTDEYGGTQGIVDYGWGNDRIAIRVAAIQQNGQTRRTNLQQRT